MSELSAPRVSLHPRRDDEYLDLEIPVTDGDLAGWTVTVRYRLTDGRCAVDWVRHRPPSLAPLNTATSRALRSIGLGDTQQLTESCLTNMVGQNVALAVPWLEAFAATRKRPGRAGTAPALWAQVAARRVEAEDKAPGRAIRYMVQTWPQQFSSQRSAWAKVNKATSRGMLEHTEHGPRLTELALKLLEGAEE